MPRHRGYIAALVFFVIASFLLAACTSSPKPDREQIPGPASVENRNEDPDQNVDPDRPASTADKRPNVVLILVDDMTATDIRFLPKTVKLLGEEGITFPNMIAPNPLCCPARASLVTGQYSHNNGVYSNKGINGGLDSLIQPDNTLGAWLQKAGYSTAFFGKYLNGYGNAEKETIPLGWDWWDATGKGTYAFTRFQFANNGDPVEFEKDYITTRLRARSDALIQKFSEERERSGKPFFIFDSYVAPHGAIGAPDADVRAVGKGPIPEEKYRNLYPNLRNVAEKKPSFNVAIEDYPLKGSFDGARHATRLQDVDELQTQFLNRARSLASVDDAVEQTVQKLKATGQLENTLIMFTSDNGYLLGEHQRTGKVVALNESIHVPLLLRGPGLAVNAISSRWATHSDVVATILEAAQAEAGRPQDGLSLTEANTKDPSPTSAILVENGSALAESESDVAWNYRGVLMGERYTYTQWQTAGSGEELYDNLLDPYQLRNLAYDPAYGPVRDQARKALEALEDCSGPGACTYPLDKLAEPIGLDKSKKDRDGKKARRKNVATR